MKSWLFDLLNNQGVKTSLSECLIANVALLATSWVPVRFFSKVIMKSLERVYHEARAGRMKWLPLDALGTRALHASSSLGGKAVYQKAVIMSA